MKGWEIKGNLIQHDIKFNRIFKKWGISSAIETLLIFIVIKNSKHIANSAPILMSIQSYRVEKVSLAAARFELAPPKRLVP